MSRIALLGCASLLPALALPGTAWGQAAPAPFTTGYRYDGGGRQTGVILPKPDATGTINYAATRTSYNVDGNPVTVEKGELAAWQDETIDPANWTGFTVFQVETTVYDTHGRKIRTSVSLAAPGSKPFQVTDFSYDAHERPLCTAVRMNPAVSGLAAPADACILGTEGTQGPDRITQNSYLDPFGQVGAIKRAVGTPLEQTYVTYSYGTALGDLDKPTSLIDANGNKTTMAYGGSIYSKITQMTFPSRTTPGQVNSSDYEAYTYDSNGNRTSLRKRDGLIINYTYDALNRMTLKDRPDSATRDVYYSYDLRGLQTAAQFYYVGGQGQTNIYDSFGRLKKTTGLGGWELNYQYDMNGNRTRITHPDGIYFAYEYDGLDRQTRIYENGPTVITRYGYRADGQLALLNRASGSNTTYGYGTASYDTTDLRLSAITHHFAGGTTGDVTLGFPQYNPANQIAQRTRDNDAFAYPYANASADYTANGLNQYSAVGGVAYCYDPNGSLTYDGSSAYRYDDENRLIEKHAGVAGENCATTGALPGYSGTLQAALTYDPLGHLYRIVAGGVTRRFLYDGDALIEEYNAGGALQQRYVHGDGKDVPLVWYAGATVSSSNRRFLHADQQGSIVAWSSSAGAAIINSYSEYGAPAMNNVGAFQYTGQVWLPEVQLYYYKARIYSARIGRFFQTDPVGHDDQINLYTYVNNDPLNRRDFTGAWQIGDQFDSAREAAIDAIKSVNGKSIAENVEYGGRIKLNSDGKYYATLEGSGERAVALPAVNQQGSDFGDWHTHGNYSKIDPVTGIISLSTPEESNIANDDFSSGPGGDIEQIRTAAAIAKQIFGITDYKSWLGTPGEYIREYDPSTETDIILERITHENYP